MLNLGLINSLPDDYEHFDVQDGKTVLSDPIKISVLKLKKFRKRFWCY